MADRTFDGARIIITGATGEFGSRLTRRLTGEGASVIATGRDEARLAQLGAATTVAADLRDPGASKQILDAVGPHGVDGLINAAGVVAFGALSDTSEEVIAELFQVNVTGPLQLMGATLPAMNDGGFIAAISGVVATQPMAGLTPYSASKAAMASSLTALRRELRKQKIDVIDLQPPHTETGLADRPLSGEAPKMPTGADPDAVVEVMLQAILDGSRVVGAGDFS